MASTTVIRALRDGIALPQKAAAERIGVTPATLAAYEGGRFTPSTAKTWQIARGLALGSPSKGETTPRFLLTFALFGQRFLADADGRVVIFRDPWSAHAHAGRLIDAGFLDVAVVPTWRSRRRALLARVDARGEVQGDELSDPLADLLEYASGLAAEFDRFQHGLAPGSAER
jgi:transcriptional regulator with XRE-family HTH domain